MQIVQGSIPTLFMVENNNYHYFIDLVLITALGVHINLAYVTWIFVYYLLILLFKFSGHTVTANGKVSPALSVPERILLNEDLQLSESSGSSDSEWRIPSPKFSSICFSMYSCSCTFALILMLGP